MTSPLSRQRSASEAAVGLLREVVAASDILFVMGKGPQAVMEGWVDSGKTRVSVQDGWVAVESEAWHCHIELGRIAALRFVQDTDPHDPARQAFSVRFLGAEGEPLLMIFIGDMYDDAGALRPEKTALFRGLEDRYGSGKAG